MQSADTWTCKLALRRGFPHQTYNRILLIEMPLTSKMLNTFDVTKYLQQLIGKVLHINVGLVDKV